jgi:hypothetical protein
MMKRALLLVCVLSIALTGFTQERIPVSQELTKKSVTRQYQVPVDPVPPMVNPTSYTKPAALKEAKLVGDETETMETLYDLQTNTMLSNRLVVWENGDMAAVSTWGQENPAGFAFPDRGSGYNFYSAATGTWGPKPTARIESVRTGWPSIAAWGTDGEVVVAHQSGTAPLIISTRETRGAGAWEEHQLYGPNGTAAPQYLWPRMNTSGENNEYIHLFALTAPSANGGVPYMNQDGALLYNRSTDGGQTWDYEGVLIEGLGEDYYTDISADDYGVYTRGDIVVMLQASAWKDLFFLKSTDNGETWEKTIVWEHPYPFFDFDNTLMDDTLYSVDNSANAAIDDNGVVHVTWGISRVARLAAAPPDPGSYSYWPFTDGIGYWNETMGQIPEADNPHHTMMPEYLEDLGMLVGWTHDVNNSGFVFDYEGTAETPFAVYRALGISTMPTIATYGSMIAIAYASATETYTTADGLYNYHHIWTRFSYDYGQTWNDYFTDLQANEIFHLYDECIYPVFAENTNPDGLFQMVYMADIQPGVYLDEDEQLEPTINRLIHTSFDFTVGMDEKPGQVASGLTVAQSYPNPTSGVTNVAFEIAGAADVSIEVFNMTGQRVLEIPARTMQAGNQSIAFDASKLTSGVYFYTVTAGNEKATRKMIVN